MSGEYIQQARMQNQNCTVQPTAKPRTSMVQQGAKKHHHQALNSRISVRIEYSLAKLGPHSIVQYLIIHHMTQIIWC